MGDFLSAGFLEFKLGIVWGGRGRGSMGKQLKLECEEIEHNLMLNVLIEWETFYGKSIFFDIAEYRKII